VSHSLSNKPHLRKRETARQLTCSLRFKKKQTVQLPRGCRKNEKWQAGEQKKDTCLFHACQVIIKIKELFSEEAFKYAILVFTHGEQLAQGKKIKEFVLENKDLSELLKKCGGRCHVVDNEYWNNNQPDLYRDNQFQIRQLLSTINELVQQHGGECYTNKLLQEVEKNIQKETKRTGSRERAKKNVTDFFFKKSAGIDPKVLLEALLGIPEMVKVVLSAVFGLPGVTMWTTLGAAVGATVGAFAGPVGGAVGAAAGVAVGGALGGFFTGWWGKPKTE
uniref:AIG1-type G domain-containing protein n=1 Tax=Salarias fasciatus TaxID=181472 RepID=A0A672HL44_SALFA